MNEINIYLLTCILVMEVAVGEYGTDIDMLADHAKKDQIQKAAELAKGIYNLLVFTLCLLASNELLKLTIKSLHLHKIVLNNL